jgi:hypothetical protein
MTPKKGPTPRTCEQEALGGLESLDQLSQAVDSTLPKAAITAENLLLGTLKGLQLPAVSSEGILWFVGIVLVLAGSLYFTQSNWAAWSAATRAMLVTGGLIAYEALFVVLSWVVRRSARTTRIPERVLAGIALHLVPMVAVALYALSKSTRSLALAGIAWVLSSTLAAIAGGAFHRALCAPFFLASAVVLFAIGGAGSELAALHPGLYAIAVLALLILLGEVAVRTARGLQIESASMRGFAALHLAYLGVASGAALIALFPSQIPLGDSGVLAALAALSLERASRQEGLLPRGVSRVAVVALALTAMGLASTLSLTRIDARVAMLFTSSFATLALLRRGLVEERRLPLVLGLLTGLAVYFFIPAPFQALLDLVMRSAKHALGYTDRPLPVAFYGLTFIPYLALLHFVTRALERSSRGRLAGAVRWTLYALAVALSMLAFTSFVDARPVLFALPIYVVYFAFESRRLESFLATVASALAAILASACVLRAGWAFGFDAGPAAASVALAGFAFVPSLSSARANRHPLALVAIGSALLSIAASIALRIDGAGEVSSLWPTLAAASMLIVALASADARLYALAIAASIIPILIGAPSLLWAGTGLAIAGVLLLLARALAGRDSALSLPAAEIAPCVALLAGILIEIATPSWHAGRLAPVAAVLAVSPFVSGRAPWCLAASAATAALAAAAAHQLGVHPIWGAFAVAALLPIASLTIDRALEAPADFHAWLRGSAVALGVAVVAWMALDVGNGAHGMSASLAFHLGAVLSLLLFAVSGLDLFFAAALVAGIVALDFDLFPVLGSAHFAWLAPIDLVALVIATLALAAPPRRAKPSFLFASAPSPWVPAVLTYVGLVPLLGALALALYVFNGAIIDLEGLLFFGACFTAVAAWTYLDVTRSRGRAAMLATSFVLTACAIGVFVLREPALVPAVALSGLILSLRIPGGGNRGSIFRAMGAFALVVAVLGSRLQTAGPQTTIALASSALAWAIAHRRRPSVLRLIATVLTALSATTFFWFALGRALATGRPEIAILPFVATGPVIIAYVLGVVAKRSSDDAAIAARSMSHALIVISALLAAIALFSLPDATALDRVATHAVLIASLVHAVLAARRTDRTRFAILAELVLALMWIELKRRTPFLASAKDADACAMIAGAFFFTGVYTLARRGGAARAFERSSRVTALVLPALAALTAHRALAWDTAAFALACSAAYAVIARAEISKWAGPLAAVAFNISVLIAWTKIGIPDPQLYALPIAASLLVLGHVYKDDLSPEQTALLRFVALGGVYLASLVSILAFDVPSHALVMACISVAGAVVGVLLRIRSYLFMGAAFLVIDLATSMVRFGLEGQNETTIVLTALGLAIIGAMILFSFHRAAILDRARKVLGAVETWPL